MTPTPAPRVDVRRAEDRARTSTPWLDSRHSFSFGRHYDPANTSHGLLLVNNDDRLAPGGGFDAHPHRDVEIVTWVLQGSLVHEDSAGHTGVVVPGVAQRMSAGTGVLHSERNDASGQPLHLVQMWLPPDTTGRPPGYEQREVTGLDGGLVPVASGLPGVDAAVHLGNRHAVLHAARLLPGQRVVVPEAPSVHLFVPRGAVTLEGTGPLQAGDAVRLTGSGGQALTADEPAEVLVWEMHA